jgi:hypothetical protein
MKWLTALLIAFATSGTLLAQNEPAPGNADSPEPAAAAEQPAATEPPPGRSYAVVICGLPGDADHRKLFAETVDRLYNGLAKLHGFAHEDIVVLWPDEPVNDDGEGVRATRGPSTRESIASTIAEIEQKLAPEDRLWLFVLGHAHYDGRYSWLNIPGTDLHQVDFGKLLAGIRCREQVFFITTAASGFFHKALAAPGRIVVTATEPDLEVNETLFPHHLSRTLAEPPSAKELDVDEDGSLTLLDVYLHTCRQVAQEYATNMLLATEHAQIDDSGDGRGTEVQADYLPEELGGRLRAGANKPARTAGDGVRTKGIVLRIPAEALPTAEEPEAATAASKPEADDAKVDPEPKDAPPVTDSDQ